MIADVLFYLILFVIAIGVLMLIWWAVGKRHDVIRIFASTTEKIKSLQKNISRIIIYRMFLFGGFRFASIILGITAWLFYGIFKSGLIISIWLDPTRLETLANICIWVSIISCAYALIEWFFKLCFYGSKYFMYGERGCFTSRQRPWFEDEENYLKKGDWRGFGNFLFNHLIHNKPLESNATDSIKSKLKLRMRIFLFKGWITFWYNSFLFRIADLFIVVLVLMSLFQLLRGNALSLDFLQPVLQDSESIREALECPFNNLAFLLVFRFIVEKDARHEIVQSFLYGKLNKIIISLGTFVAIALVIASYTKRGLMPGLVFVDALFTVFFLIELGMKVYEDGLAYFLHMDNHEKSLLSKLDLWNCVDAFVVLASITSIFMLKDDYQGLVGMYAMIVLRLIRVLKLLRVLKLFQRDWAHLLEGIKYATVKSIPIIIIFAVIIAFLGFLLYIVSAQFGIGREYFNNPIDAIFSLFQLFTYDGWHTIPASITVECQELWPSVWWVDVAVRFGFCALVFAGGIIGVALLNSVFVDGMLGRDKSDEERSLKLEELSEKLDELNSKIASLEKREIGPR